MILSHYKYDIISNRPFLDFKPLSILILISNSKDINIIPGNRRNRITLVSLELFDALSDLCGI